MAASALAARYPFRPLRVLRLGIRRRGCGQSGGGRGKRRHQRAEKLTRAAGYRQLHFNGSFAGSPPSPPLVSRRQREKRSTSNKIRVQRLINNITQNPHPPVPLRLVLVIPGFSHPFPPSRYRPPLLSIVPLIPIEQALFHFGADPSAFSV